MKKKIDVSPAVNILKSIPKLWDGKTSILEMKNADFNQWKQMEWILF